MIFFGRGAALGGSADAAFSLMEAASEAPLIPGKLITPGSSVVAMLPRGSFRIGVDIRPRLEDDGWDKLNTPILESPVLDDLTFTYIPPGGARILHWESP